MPGRRLVLSISRVVAASVLVSTIDTVPDSAGVGVGGRETGWDGLCGSGGGVENLDGTGEHGTLLIEGQRDFTA